VSDLVAELIAEGLVVELGQREDARPGKPATLIDVDRGAFQIVGVDLSEHQRFLGRPATYGDDRSLTNYVLRNWDVRYDELARSRTIVPTTFKVFLRQQLRWKRSWTRESLIVGRFIWRRSPVGSVWAYLGIILPLVAPLVAVRAIAWQPLVGGAGAPFVYLIGIYAMALVYGLYYGLRHGRYDTLWVFGVLFVFFYLAFLLWQTWYAILTSRNSSWGTRTAAAEVSR